MRKMFALLAMTAALAPSLAEPSSGGSGGGYRRRGKQMPRKDWMKRKKRMRMQKESRKINRK